ncbi:MAG: hypothetical protein KC474_02915 [Cyanobacteria bacterium HKST-UBA04]|nr:hypothetical protein [Cyanobacteria bacterium HKST-UBA04]
MYPSQQSPYGSPTGFGAPSSATGYGRSTGLSFVDSLLGGFSQQSALQLDMLNNMVPGAQVGADFGAGYPSMSGGGGGGSAAAAGDPTATMYELQSLIQQRSAQIQQATQGQFQIQTQLTQLQQQNLGVEPGSAQAQAIGAQITAVMVGMTTQKINTHYAEYDRQELANDYNYLGSLLNVINGQPQNPMAQQAMQLASAYAMNLTSRAELRSQLGNAASIQSDVAPGSPEDNQLMQLAAQTDAQYSQLELERQQIQMQLGQMLPGVAPPEYATQGDILRQMGLASSIAYLARLDDQVRLVNQNGAQMGGVVVSLQAQLATLDPGSDQAKALQERLNTINQLGLSSQNQIAHINTIKQVVSANLQADMAKENAIASLRNSPMAAQLAQIQTQNSMVNSTRMSLLNLLGTNYTILGGLDPSSAEAASVTARLQQIQAMEQQQSLQQQQLHQQFVALAQGGQAGVQGAIQGAMPPVTVQQQPQPQPNTTTVPPTQAPVVAPSGGITSEAGLMAAIQSLLAAS